MDLQHFKTEVLIIKNPMFYQNVHLEAFNILIQDGRWIPLVFGAIERVVNEYFLRLCELDWDYLRDSSAPKLKQYNSYKNIYFTGLKDADVCFVKQVADEIENEIRLAADETLLSLDNQEE